MSDPRNRNNLAIPKKQAVNALGLGGVLSNQAINSLMRPAYASEMNYFKKNTHVAGMAAEDDRVILNPYTKMSIGGKQSIVLNESARIAMRHAPPPTFDLTPEQTQRFADYGDIQSQRETIAARILSDDPSAGNPTQSQRAYVETLRKRMTENKGKIYNE
jgi:hypothetical protein